MIARTRHRADRPSVCLTAALLGITAHGCKKAEQEPAPLSKEPTTAKVAVVGVSQTVQRVTEKSPGAAPAAPGRCKRMCAPSRQLGCKLASECETQCEAMSSTSTCRSELDGFFSCLVAQPVERWECLEDGTGVIRQGYCEAEQARFALCAQKTGGN